MRSSQSTQVEQYQAHCQSMQERIGQKGMVQHCFADQAKADALLAWLKQQANLKALGIDKASVKKEEQPDKSNLYVVRLSQEQRDAILGLTAADKELLVVSGPNNETPLHKAA